MNKLMKRTSVALAFWLGATQAMARVSLEPYVSVTSTKSISTNKSKGTESSSIDKRTTYGIRGNLSFWKLFKLQASVGQAKTEKTMETKDAVDDYDEIDFNSDLNMSTNNPSQEIKLTETQRIGRVGIVLDPGFWIFILRAKGGVQATQRIIEKEQQGQEKVITTAGPTYKPYAGAGAGIKFGPRMFAVAEYNLFLYKFPEYAPFEREVSVSYGISF